MYPEKEDFGGELDLEMIKQISPIAWHHINLFGRYEFDKEQWVIDMEKIMQKIRNG